MLFFVLQTRPSAVAEICTCHSTVACRACGAGAVLRSLLLYSSNIYIMGIRGDAVTDDV